MGRNKRYNVTVPWGIGEALERWAEGEGNKPTTLASYLVEVSVRQAMSDGKIPDSIRPAAEESRTQISVLDLQRLADQLGIPSDRLLKAIKEIKGEVINGIHSD